MVLVPQEIYDRENRLFRPKENDIIQMDNSMSNILQNESLNSYDKVNVYNQNLKEMVQKVDSYRDDTKLIKKENVETRTIPLYDEILESLPPKLRKKGKLLLDYISRKNNILSWNKAGRVKIRGKEIFNMHIIDVFSKLINRRNVQIPNLMLFMQALDDLNTPKSFYDKIDTKIIFSPNLNKTVVNKIKKVKSSKEKAPYTITRLRRKVLDKTPPQLNWLEY